MSIEDDKLTRDVYSIAIILIDSLFIGHVFFACKIFHVSSVLKKAAIMISIVYNWLYESQAAFKNIIEDYNIYRHYACVILYP